MKKILITSLILALIAPMFVSAQYFNFVNSYVSSLQSFLKLGLSNETVVSGGAFSPTDISGLQLWLKPEALVGFTDGDSVNTWPDSSGNSNDASFDSGVGGACFAPTYEDDVTRSLNGYPSVYYGPGLGGRLVSDLGNTGTTMTGFVVIKPINITNPQRILTFADNTTGAVFDYDSTSRGVAIYTDGSNFAGYRNATLSTISATANTNVIVTVKFDGSNHTLYSNSTSSTPVASTGSFNYPNTYIGAFGIGVSCFLQSMYGDMYEVIIYSGALGNTDRQNVEDYLNDKYNIY